MHYSTLGYQNNPFIIRYQSQFLEKIQNLWKLHIGGEVPADEFLLFPDSHGLLLAATRFGNPDKDSLLGELQKFYTEFKKYGSQCLLYEEDYIPGTEIALTLQFQNPDIDKHTHPDHKKNHVGISYGSKSPEDWRKLFSEAFIILERVSPGFMSEVNSIIRKIIPFDVSKRCHNSGSFSDVIGHLLMSYPVEMTHPEFAILEAILHEYNHNKINLVIQTETLILSNKDELYYSPYRPDARHIHGIYLGLHALTGAYWVLWHAHVHGIIHLPNEWQEKAVLFVLKNGLSLQVLDKYASLTPKGKEFLEEMRQVHNECLAFIKKANLNPKIVSTAKNAMIAHFRDVQSNYPQLRS